MPFKMITTDRELAELRKSFQGKGIDTIAMDFEGEFNLHCYGEHLCLIQIFDGTDSYLVDPFAISAEELKNLLESESLAKLFFGASSDYSLVYKKYKIRMARVVDLQCYAEVLELPGKGLDSVLSEILGIPPAVNKKKLQMHNWMSRPIGREALEYALNDVRHLFRLRDALAARVDEAGLQDQLAEVMKAAKPSFNYDLTPRMFRTMEFKKLSRGAQETLKALYYWRDGHSAALNCSPENLLKKASLFSLAQNPDSVKSLRPQLALSPRLLMELRSILKIT